MKPHQAEIMASAPTSNSGGNGDVDHRFLGDDTVFDRHRLMPFPRRHHRREQAPMMR